MAENPNNERPKVYRFDGKPVNSKYSSPAEKKVPPTPPPSPPQPLQPKTPAPQPKRSNLIWGVVGLFLFLFIVGMVLLILMLTQNPQNNPLLTLLGIDPASLKGILSSIVSGVFGFLAFVFLIGGTVGIFRRLTVAKDDKISARSATILTASGFGLAFVMVAIWLTLYFYISQLQIGSRLASDILTEPAQVTQLTAPVTVHFSAQGIRERYRTSNIIAYNWDFDGDGKFNDGNGIEIDYAFNDKGKNNGLFNVSVQAVFTSGQPIVFSRPVTIANISPEALFTVDPGIEGFTPFVATFDATTSSDPDGTLIRYEWDFDDDGRFDETGMKVQHTFEKDGKFVVTLQVTDNNGAKKATQQTINVAKSELSQVVIDARPGFEGNAPFEVTFDGVRSTLPRTDIQSYLWNFGDGSRDVRGRTVKHTFVDPGTYTVALQISGADGRKESNIAVIVVNAPKAVPRPVITTDPVSVSAALSGKAPLAVKFSARNSQDSDNNMIEYLWSFQSADKVDATGEEVQHTFTKAGDYTVTLKILDSDDNEGTATLKVSVEELGIVPKVTATPISGNIPLDVSFDASGSFVTDDSTITGYRFDFGDETSQTTSSSRQTHRYVKEGIFTAKVTVLTSKGRQATAEIVISVLTQPLQARFDYRPETAKAPATIFFDGSTSTGAIASYLWDFGDSSISRLKNPEHTFQSAGTYKVRLTVQDGSNNVSQFEKSITLE